MKLNTYLNYGGNCAEAFHFYEKHLGAKITFMMKHGESPDAAQVAPAMKDKVLHARIEIGGTGLMASDVPPEAKFEPMRSAYLSLSVDSSAEAERIYGLLADGG
jgi:PhnB protein